LPALWTAIFYDDRALAEVEELVHGWEYEQVAELRTRAWREGLRAVFRGRPLAEVAERLVSIADGGLERRAIVDPNCGQDERVHLARLRRLVGEGKTPADVLLEGMRGDNDPAAIVARTSLKWE
jgi:glutamate--cysteine ligase